MKKILLSTLTVAVSLSFAACKSDGDKYAPETVTYLLEKQADWTSDEYRTMAEQLEATNAHIEENVSSLTDSARNDIIRQNADLSYYLLEALNNGKLPPDVAQQLNKYFGIEK